jgi:hypothetical protein
MFDERNAKIMGCATVSVLLVADRGVFAQPEGRRRFLPRKPLVASWRRCDEQSRREGWT